LFCLFAVLLVNAPLLINEVKTKGQNSQSFLETVDEKEAQDSSHNFYEKIKFAELKTHV
jgi:hypothetical protein